MAYQNKRRCSRSTTCERDIGHMNSVFVIMWKRTNIHPGDQRKWIHSIGSSQNAIIIQLIQHLSWISIDYMIMLCAKVHTANYHDTMIFEIVVGDNIKLHYFITCETQNTGNQKLWHCQLCRHWWHRVLSKLLQWRHNVRDGVSNHQPQDCFLRRRS